MCGIAGVLGPMGSDRDLLERMAGCLAHRGPDAQGLLSEGPIGLAHRRLAVLGLGEAGAQPMTSPSGRFTVVYNGELYNHLELRAELAQTGHAPVWRGGSDTETLLAGVEAWGIRGLLHRSIGMFALALWDRHEGRLTLARDRMGEKPLSYAQHGSDLLFASQPSALRAVPGFTPTIDREALADLLRFGQVPGARTIHVEIRALPPGTLLEATVDRSGHVLPVGEPEAWWSFLDVARAGIDEPLTGSDADLTDTVEEAVRSAVASQLISDVPLGAFLSGGIDSSLVVSIMRQLTSQPVRTFTIGFSEQRFDESPFARAIARHLDTDHTELIVSAADALAVIPELPRHYDEPFADASQIPTLLVSRLARGSVTVALSGDGGDELFGGYSRYPLAERNTRVPRPIALGAMLALRSIGQHRRASAAAALGRGPEVAVRRLLSANPAAESFVRGVDPLAGEGRFNTAWDATDGLGGLYERFMALDTTGYLPDDILHKVDRAAMAVSLETRVPLLDHRLVELAWQLPHHVKVRRGVGKWILREVLSRHVPRDLFERPKVGFGIPLGAWLRGPLRTWADELLAPDVLTGDELLDVKRVRSLWQQHIDGRWDVGYDLWPILMFQAWLHDGGSA